MLRTAREHFAPADRVHFVVCDLLALPFHNCFDVIFSTAAFHWVPDHDLLFRNLYSALKPGGALISQCGGGPNLKRLHDRVAALSQTPSYAPNLANYQDKWIFSDANTAAERLRQAGFCDVKTWLEPAPTQFPGKAEYLEFISNVVLHRRLEHLPKTADRESFLQELARQAAGDDPPFLLDYWRLNLDARKPR
jgi:trans-aconitate 2-methyltransferase